MATQINTYKAQLKYVQVGPKKMKRVASVVRTLNVVEAEYILKALPQRTAKVLLKLLQSAIANAANNFNEKQTDSLYISKLLVNEGAKQRRFRPRARGRINTIIKQSSHVYIELSKKGELNG